MRLLLLFVGIVAAAGAATAAVNRIVDPSDEFYSGAPLTAALSSSPQCLLADEIIGGASYPEFKEDLFRRRRPTTLVLGSSRVLKIGAHPGERSFLNMGFPEISPGPLLDVMRFIAHNTPKGERLTLYVAVDFFWFNPNAPFIDDPAFRKTTFRKVRYLLSRNTLRASWDLIRRSRTLAFRGWRKERVGRYCVVDRGSPFRNWKPDGTRIYSFELSPRLERPTFGDFTSDLLTLRGGLYGNWRGFDWKRLHLLDETLALAQSRGWNVVGFSPPDATRYVRLFSTKLARPWATYGRELPALFAKHGFAYIDWRDVKSVRCAETDFVDNGYHTDARCSMRMRAKLDAAAHS